MSAQGEVGQIGGSGWWAAADIGGDGSGTRLLVVAELSGGRMTLQPSVDPADYRYRHRLRVRFGETDAMAVVHHSAYLLYLEEARVAWLRAIGHPYEAIRADGVDFGVLEAFVRYRRPLVFDDEVDVHLAAGALTGTTFQVAYLLTAGQQVRATAVTVHGAMTATGRPTRMPSWLAELTTG